MTKVTERYELRSIFGGEIVAVVAVEAEPRVIEALVARMWTDTLYDTLGVLQPVRVPEPEGREGCL